MNRQERRAQEAQQRRESGITILVRLNGKTPLQVPFKRGKPMRDVLGQTDSMIQSEGMSWDGALALLAEMMEDLQHESEKVTEHGAAAVGGLALWVMARHARDPDTAKFVQTVVDNGGKLLADIETSLDMVTLVTNVHVGEIPDRLHS